MKKVLALVLVAVMAFGMASVALAASFTVTGWVGGNTLADGYGRGAVVGYSGIFGTAARSAASLNAQTVTYGTKVIPYDKVKDYVNLYVDMFSWDAAKGGQPTVLANPKAVLTAADIRNSKLTVRTSVSAGSKAIDSVTINSKEGRIDIKYLTEFVSTKDLDFEFTVYLVINGKRQDDQSITFVGTLGNDITEVYAADDYVDTQYGVIAYAQDFVPKVEVDLGNGVSIFTKFFKEKKYYGTATRDADAADDVVFSKYPDVDNVVTLKTVGLNSTGDIVKLDTDYANYWVYDKDLNYLGQSSAMLPYSTKYYLANKKLDIASDEVDEGEAEAPTTAPVGQPTTGGDVAPANNANANPGTGR